MTFDGTNVDPDELDRFSTGARKRADSTTAAADAVGGVHMGRGMLGVFSMWFLDDATRSQQDIVSTMRAIGANLRDDSTIATTNAGEARDTEAAQANRFKEPS
jgi:hypothetical protein